MLMPLIAVAFAVTADPAPTVVLRNATIIDGTGEPARTGDVAFRGDRIVAVGRFAADGPVTEFDARGLVVAPGFIDLHTHSDYPLQKEATRANLSYASQGVTTVVTGNCGSGPTDVAAFYKKLESGGIGGNVAHLVPHNDVRSKVMGNVNREPTADELAKMVALVDAGMADGAWGLATGLIYNPGTYSKTEEIIALARPAARHGGIYASHIRDEGRGLLDAIRELIRVGQEAGLPAHVSHIKCSGRQAWGQSVAAIRLIESARAAGQAVTADQYPYTASSTSLRAMVIPARFREGSARQLRERLDDPDLGPQLRAEIDRAVGGRDGGRSIRIATFSPRTDWQGKSLAEIATMEGKSPADIAIEIEKQGGAQAVSFGMNEEDLRLFARQPWVATASDGSSKVPDDTVPHPRSYGTFPRKIGLYAVREKVIPLEQAVRSSSGLPADILKLPDRGYLKVGQFADIVVFDPNAMIDKATFDQPHRYSEGVRYLYVNGVAVIDDGKTTGRLPGRALRHVSAIQTQGGKP
jgi:N-acyl-D-aspartate/D-glutamate deacylase